MIALVILFCTGLLSLFAAFAKKTQLVITIVALGLAAAIGFMASEWNTPSDFSYKGLLFDHYAVAFSTVTLIATFLVSLIAYGRFKESTDHIGDYYGLLLFSACGALCLFSFTDLFMLFLGVEILSIPLYVLAGSKKNDLRSNEAALKYFLMGSFATGILLFGIALIYGSTGSFDIATIASLANSSPMFLTGVILVMIAMCFKVGAAPFHFWSPDVYTGSPTVITSFMATVVKIAGFGAFLKLFMLCFGSAAETIIPTLSVIAALTMTIANITAVYQDNFKRMLAYSSVSHVGYILLAFIANREEQTSFNTLFYLASYALATLLIFTIYMYAKGKKQDDSIGVFNGLGKRAPLLAFAAVASIISLAGIPPTSGFIGKYLLFASAFENHTWLVFVAILNSAVSIYYYFKIIMVMYFGSEETEASKSQISVINGVVIVLCTGGVFLLGILSGALHSAFQF